MKLDGYWHKGLAEVVCDVARWDKSASSLWEEFLHPQPPLDCTGELAFLTNLLHQLPSVMFTIFVQYVQQLSSRDAEQKFDLMVALDYTSVDVCTKFYFNPSNSC